MYPWPQHTSNLVLVSHLCPLFQIGKLFQEACNRAKDVFLSWNFGLKTNVLNGQTGKLEEMLITRGFQVDPQGRVQRDANGRPLRGDGFYGIPWEGSSHVVVNAEDTTKTACARIKFVTKSGQVLDPWTDDIRSKYPTELLLFLFLFHCLKLVSVEEVDEVKYEIQHEGSSMVLNAEMISPNPRQQYPLEESSFECPALVLVLLPEKNDLYNAVKMLGDFRFNVPTQCLVWKTIERQRGGGLQ